MARFQLWDTPSATILEETDEPHQMSESVQSFIDEYGLGVLGDLVLSEATAKDDVFNTFSGDQIVIVLRERLATGLAS
jgi:hypothetical protein